ncbi:metallophosphoesterase family protein [Halobacillus andaensis]|uniref:metallophosphoesterase family protein n=1 Tax=Halobacillus andaensis TaxID=1176239 RepID=UPI003D75DD45
MKSVNIDAPIELNPFESVDYQPTADKLDAFYKESSNEWDIVCFGHHHPVHLFHSSNRIYLNPGSLGCFHKPLARYAIIHNNEQSPYIVLKEVPYNKEKLIQAFERMKVPKREFILNTFLSSQPSSSYMATCYSNL